MWSFLLSLRVGISYRAKTQVQGWLSITHPPNTKTLRATNIPPETGWLEDYISTVVSFWGLLASIFRCETVRLQGVYFNRVTPLKKTKKIPHSKTLALKLIAHHHRCSGFAAASCSPSCTGGGRHEAGSGHEASTYGGLVMLLMKQNPAIHQLRMTLKPCK